jgi:hypothetical protein
MPILVQFSTALVLTAVLLPQVQAANSVYRSVDQSGSVVYSDQPSKGAKRVTIQPNTSTYTPPPAPVFKLDPPTEKKAEARKAVKYDSIRIVSPAPEETVRDNEGLVSVAVALTPKLEEGHQLRLFLDGKPSVTLDKSIGTLSEVERGEHRVLAEVADAKGQVLARSDPVLFFMKRHSVLHPSPVNAPPVPTPLPQ